METYEITYSGKWGTEYCTLIVGEADEIKSVYRSMCKAERKGTTGMGAEFCDFPKFRFGGMYGITIDGDDLCFRVVSSDTIVRFMSDNAYTIRKKKN